MMEFIINVESLIEPCRFKLPNKLEDIILDSLVFSKNTGEYLKKQNEKTLDSSKNKEVIDSSKEDIKESAINQQET